MKKTIWTALPFTYLSLLSGNALAGQATPTVPEMDGGSAMIAIGLAVGVVALVREHRNKK